MENVNLKKSTKLYAKNKDRFLSKTKTFHFEAKDTPKRLWTRDYVNKLVLRAKNVDLQIETNFHHRYI